MLTFKQFNEAKSKPIIFTFGRFNPPTIGHEKLINKIKELGQGKEVQVFMSQTQDSKKNPLSFSEKLKFMKQAFKGIKISTDKKLKSPFDVLEMLSDGGYKDVTMVVGSDRVDNFKGQVAPYLSPGKSIYLEFDNFEVVSAGDRDPDADDASGISASKLREFVAEDDFTNFKKGVPKGIDAKQLFSKLRSK